MRIRCLFLFVCVLGFLMPSMAVAQEVFNDYVTQPDVWRPANVSPPGVDAKGDLNLSIPVLTVPGRNGLGFSVQFSYQSSIKSDQTSSWIGLGWSFDPGSITRDVQSVYQNGEAHTVDFTEAPDAQPDMYYVSVPRQGFSMVRRNTGGTLFPPARSAVGDFVPTQWAPWKIETEVAPGGVTVDNFTTSLNYDGPLPSDTQQDVKADYSKFLLTDPSGNRYLFAAPTLASHRFVFNDLGGISFKVENYVSTWRLVAIMGPDYVTNNRFALPSDDALGSWVRFEYGAADTRHRDYSDHGKEIHQARYLSAIITPTHRADFMVGGLLCEIQCGVSSEGKPWLNDPNIYGQLSQIVLKTRAGAQIKTVNLGFSNEGHDGFDGGQPRLKLETIDFNGTNTTGTPLPGYFFEYLGREPGAVVNAAYTDDFGYYTTESNGTTYPPAFGQNNADGSAWSLNKIVYPTGGWVDIFYENDAIYLDATYNPATGQTTYTPFDMPYTTFAVGTQSTGTLSYEVNGGNHRQGGARVTRMIRYSGVPNDSYDTRFRYGKGRLSGIPPAHWTREHGGPFFKANGRGKAAVYYTSITRDNSDGSSHTTHYSTDINYPNVAPLAATLFQFGTNGPGTVIQDNGEINWGISFENVTYGEGMSETSTTVHALSRGGLASAFSPTTTNIWWRFANLVTEERIDRNGIYTERVFFYDPTTGLVKRVEEHAPGEPTRVTRKRYGYEVYSTLEVENRFTPVIQEDVALLTGGGGVALPAEVINEVIHDGCQVKRIGPEEDDLITICPTNPDLGTSGGNPASGTYTEDATNLTFYGATATQWGTDGGLLETLGNVPATFKPKAAYLWTADQPGVPPSFSFTAGATQNAAWQLQTTFDAYDVFGHVVEQKDAHGQAIQFVYGDNNANCTAATVNSAFRGAYLTCVKTGGGAGTPVLEQQIDYFDDGTVKDITDPQNFNTTSYTYDTHGRLKAVANNNDAIQRYAYALSRAASGNTTFSFLQPNAISTTSYTGLYHPGGDTLKYEAHVYVDGLGGSIEERARHVSAGIAQDIVTATEQDRNARWARTFKPINLTQDGSFFKMRDPAEVQSTEPYPQHTTPYTEQQVDPFGRVVTIKPPGAGPVQRFAYETPFQEDAAGNILSGRAQVTVSEDEEGNIVRSYVNAFGQNYLTQQYVATMPVQTPPSNLMGTITAVGLGANSGMGPCRFEECYEVESAEAFFRRDVNFSWAATPLKKDVFVPKEQVVFYALAPAPDVEWAVGYLLTFYDGGCHLVSDSTPKALQVTHLRGNLTGSVVLQPNRDYCIQVEAGIDAQAATNETFSLDYTIEFTRNGLVTYVEETRFEYDTAGNLAKVMPPNYFAPPLGSQAEDWATTYQYNTLGQLLAKATPDADGNNDGDPANETASSTPDFTYAYDRVGNLRFSQDPNQREVKPDPDPEKAKVEEVAFTAYDALSRPVVSGVGPASFAGLDANPGSTPCTETDTVFHTGESTLECTPENWHTVQRYDARPDQNAFPWNAAPTAIWDNVVLQHTAGRLVATAHRIDLKDVAVKEFLNLFGYTFNATAPSFQANKTIDAQGITIMGDADVTFVAGERITLKTGFSVQGGGRLTAALDPTITATAGSEWLITAYNYDQQGRIVTYYQYNAILGLVRCEYTYDLQGNVLSVKYQPGKTDRLYTWYDYDDLGRLTTVWTHEQDDKAGATREASYSYRSNGQVTQLALGHPDFIAPISYSYHVRDWLTHINNPGNIGENVFAMELFYDSSPTDDGANTYATYNNGNVATIDWVTQAPTAPDRARYAFAYDGLNRLTQGRFIEKGTSGWSTWSSSNKAYDLTSVQYDPNGNITGLHRKNQAGGGDPIAYTYTSETGNHWSNRLMKATGGVLPDGAGGTVTYTYDANGNATDGRGFSGAEYDYRNLPLRMTVPGGEMAMRYYADGQRFYKAVGGNQGWYYIRGVDGSVLAVYDENCILRYWNILSGSRPIGRVEPAFGVVLGQSTP